MEMFWGFPSSRTSKSCLCRPVTASPLPLVTTTSTRTSRTLVLILATGPESGDAIWDWSDSAQKRGITTSRRQRRPTYIGAFSGLTYHKGRARIVKARKAIPRHEKRKGEGVCLSIVEKSLLHSSDLRFRLLASKRGSHASVEGQPYVSGLRFAPTFVPKRRRHEVLRVKASTGGLIAFCNYDAYLPLSTTPTDFKHLTGVPFLSSPNAARASVV